MDRLKLTLFACVAALSMPVTSIATDASSPVRQTKSVEGFESQRPVDSLRSPLDLGELEEGGERMPRRAKGEGDSELQAFSNGEAWFYDAQAELFYDYDGDGYYHYIRVRFDVDSLFADHWIYARLFLSDDGEFWEEYHVTQDFLIDGSSPSDDYEVETELVSGFPPGLYDVLIEVYDADFGDLLADFGPDDSSSLALLPLEDLSFDEARPVITVSAEGGGGSVDLFAVLALSLALALARRREVKARIRARH
jgi:hypothetical protein